MARPEDRDAARSGHWPTSPIYTELVHAGVAELRSEPTAAPDNLHELPVEDEHAHGEDTPRGTPLDDGTYGLIPSPNHSGRGGRAVRLLMVHTAEGARTVESLGAYFSRAAVQVSSHAGIDDHRVETYVNYDQAAWTARSANTIADQVELCGFARWTREQWLGEHRRMLELLAGWLAERARARGIPLRKLSPAQVAAGQSGVCGHVDWTLGVHEGTHTDPGAGFPWDVVMELATQPTTKEPPMAVINQGTWEDTGLAVRQHLTCPVGPSYVAKAGWFSLSVGWEDATAVSVIFVGARQPDGTRTYLPGGCTDQTLPFDQRVPFWIPAGTEAISVSYDSENPVSWCLELFL